MSTLPCIALGVSALHKTHAASNLYVLASMFNQIVASKIYNFSQLPDWKNQLIANPLSLFYPWGKIGEQPFNVADRDARSDVLTYAHWLNTIEKEPSYSCLSTDNNGVLKKGYWGTYNELLKQLPKHLTGNKIVCDAEAKVKLREHREYLFSKFFSPDDVAFILQTIPSETVTK